MDRDVDEKTVVQFHEYYATVEVNQNKKQPHAVQNIKIVILSLLLTDSHAFLPREHMRGRSWES